MKKFSELGIKHQTTAFTGDKIKIERILNCKIEVQAFRIVDSKFEGKGNGKCLHLQLKKDGEQRVLFTGSTILMQMIEQVKQEDFPFETTIVNENDCYLFS